MTTVLVLALLHSDVTTLTPGVAPGVLHLPVADTVVDTVTDGQDTVVQVGAASASVHTRRVQLEAKLVGFDGDRDGLLVNGVFQRRFGVGLHVGVRADGGAGHSAARRRLARTLVTVAGSVRVVFLGTETTVSLDPLEGSIHLTAVAAHVGEASARNQLLLGERHELAVLVVVSTFQGTGGGEGPARAAGTLVLHVGDTALRNPVPVGGVALDLLLRSRVGGRASVSQVLGHGSEVLLHELGVAQAGELVVGHLPGSAGSVVLLDELVPADEDLESLQELGAVFVLNLVLGHPVEELLFVLFSVVGHGRHSEEDEESDNLIEHR